VTRFDCPEYVRAWQDTGKFPPIHDGIFALLKAKIPVAEDGTTVLDLGSSTGLLSRRMADAGYTVYAIEGSVATSNVGREAGIYDGIEIMRSRLKTEDLRDLREWMHRQEISVVMARRVFPELDDYGVAPQFLARVFAEAGVKHILVEGRLQRPYATHRLKSLSDEITALGDLWTVESYDGPHRAHLVRSDKGIADA
jgi:hypothetical protein